MNTHEGTPDATEDRRWQAFRYVAGEMSAPEAAEFEACLADDESLCLAVAQTVRLLDAVVVAADQTNTIARPVPRKPGPRSRRRAAIVAAVIASAVAIAAALLLPGGFDPDRQTARKTHDETRDATRNRFAEDRSEGAMSYGAAPGVELPERLPERLLAAWNDSAVILDEAADDATLSLTDGLILSEADELDRSGHESGPATFGWMLAAVSDDAESGAPQVDDKTWDN